MEPPKAVGAGPVLRAFCDEIGLVAAINGGVTWDPQQCHLSPGERILALGLNLLTARSPLYRVHEQFALTDTLSLLGTGVSSDALYKGQSYTPQRSHPDLGQAHFW